MIVRLVSSAQTGYAYTKVKLRTGPKLTMVKYDPMGMYAIFTRYSLLICFLVKQRVLFVEKKKSGK